MLKKTTKVYKYKKCKNNRKNKITKLQNAQTNKWIRPLAIIMLVKN
jgi:hypothetical protein